MQHRVRAHRCRQLSKLGSAGGGIKKSELLDLTRARYRGGYFL